MHLARNDPQVRRFMTIPGIGPVTALCYRATIDDPTRFKKSRSVGAYVGLISGKKRPCRDAGIGEIALGFADARKSKTRFTH
jgi:transposase